MPFCATKKNDSSKDGSFFLAGDRLEPYGVAEVRTGMSVQELAPISEFRASAARPAPATKTV
jgi:hypothetical protein